MIDVKELRIGNWIRNVEGDREEVVNLDFFRWLSVEEYDLEYYEPIQLTKEWFLKFGYNEVAPDCYLMGDYYTDIVSSEVRFYLDGDSCRYYITVKHVHQLQNLYFALTGEELKQK